MRDLATFYQSKEWINLRAMIMLERTGPEGIICARCGKPILHKYDCIAHHKIELTPENINDADIAVNPDNVELLHMRCHNEEHERFSGRRQQVFIVHGAPCSGKNTFVSMNAHNDDLVIDVDAIYRAFSLCGVHEQPGRIKPVVFAARDAALEAVKMRRGLWRTAWIITTKAGTDLERDAAIYRAQLIHVDTSKEECLRRLEERPNGRDTKAWRGYIEDYFDRVGINA